MINITPQTQYPAILPAAAFWYDANKQPLGAISSLAGQILGNPAIQNTSASQPVNTANFISVRPAAVFDNSDDALIANSTQANSDIFSSGGTLAGVFRISGSGGGGFGRIIEKSYALLLVAGSNVLRLSVPFSGTNGVFDTSSGAVQFNQNYFFIITYNSSSVSNVPTIYLNSSNGVTMTASTIPVGTVLTDSASSLVLGNRSVLDRGLNGGISEIMGFRTILTGTNLNLLINYFKNKYGL